MWNIDELEAVQMEFARESLKPAPIAISALENDAAPLEQAFEHEVELKPASESLLGAEREVLKIDEDGDRALGMRS
jgi:hypothetical protein